MDKANKCFVVITVKFQQLDMPETKSRQKNLSEMLKNCVSIKMTVTRNHFNKETIKVWVCIIIAQEQHAHKVNIWIQD